MFHQTLNSQNDLLNNIIPNQSKLVKTSMLSSMTYPTKEFANKYKIIHTFDSNGRVLRVQDYTTLEFYTALKIELKDEKMIIREFKNFEETKQLISNLKNPFLINLVDIFFDESFSKAGKVQIVKIFENIDYFLDLNSSQKYFSFLEKHSIEHFNQNEFIKILYDFILLFKSCDELTKTIVMPNTAICQQKGQFKFLLQNIIDLPFEKPVSKNLEENENVQMNHQKGFTNKLDLQKDSHRTTDTADTEKQENLQEQTTNNKNAKKSVFYYRFAVALCYELFKKMTCKVNEISEDRVELIGQLIAQQKTNKFKEMFEFFDMINKTSLNNVTFYQIDEWLTAIANHLQRHWNTYYFFKNSNIELFQEPIYRDIKSVKLVLDENEEKISETAKIISEQIRLHTKLTTLDLILSGSCLSSLECQKILEGALVPLNISRFSWHCCHNNINSDNISCLCKILTKNPLKSIDLDFSK